MAFEIPSNLLDPNARVRRRTLLDELGEGPDLSYENWPAGPGPVTRSQRYSNPADPQQEELGFAPYGDGPEARMPIAGRDDDSPMVSRGDLPRAMSLTDVLGASAAATDPTFREPVATQQYGSPIGPARPDNKAITDAILSEHRLAPAGSPYAAPKGTDAEKAADFLRYQNSQRNLAQMDSQKQMQLDALASQAAQRGSSLPAQMRPGFQSNADFLAGVGGGMKQSGRGPGGGAVEREFGPAKPLTLIDALAPGETAVVKDHMGKPMWATNDKALPRSPDEPKWSPGLMQPGGPNSPEAMSRYSEAMQRQRAAQQASGFNPNKNNGSETGLAQARAMAARGMDPTTAMATGREAVGNPIAPNSLLGGALLGPDVIKQYAQSEGMVQVAQVRAQEFATQAELARKQGDIQQADRLAQQAAIEANNVRRHEQTMAQIQAQSAQAQAAMDRQSKNDESRNRLAEDQFGLNKQLTAEQIADIKFRRENKQPEPGTEKGIETGIKIAGMDPTAPPEQAIPAQVRLLNEGKEIPADSQLHKALLKSWNDDSYDNEPSGSAWYPGNWLGRGGSSYESDAEIFARYAEDTYGLKPEIAKKFYMERIKPRW